MTIKNIEALLEEHPFFRDMKPEFIGSLAGCASNVRFKARETVFHADERADHFYIIESGKIAIDISIPGRSVLTIETLGPGQVLGWSWLFPPYEWQYGARAVEDTKAIAMDARCLRGKCETDPALGYDLMKRFSAIMARRMQRARLQMLDMYHS
jgi:CRP/FNR family cyclic AMP-dependent transcriptional regulator